MPRPSRDRPRTLLDDLFPTYDVSSRHTIWVAASPALVYEAARHIDHLPPAGLAQAVWNFRVRVCGMGTELSTETRVRCGDEVTRRQFGRYWR